MTAAAAKAAVYSLFLNIWANDALLLIIDVLQAYKQVNAFNGDAVSSPNTTTSSVM